MRAAILIATCLTFAAARKFSKQAISTPLARGGGRIVGGETADRGEFPHQIVLTRGVGGSLMCGGSLVAPDRVITAGHCCDGMSAHRLGVTVGEYDRKHQEGSEKDIAIKKMILHEDYDSWTINNDICLLHLKEEADFSDDNIGPISLPEEMEEYEARTLVREILEVHSCVVTNYLELYHGDTDVPRLGILVFTPRPPISSNG